VTAYVRSLGREVHAEDDHPLTRFVERASLSSSVDAESAMWSDLAGARRLGRRSLFDRYGLVRQNHRELVEGEFGCYVVLGPTLLTFIAPKDRPLTAPIWAAARTQKAAIVVLARIHLADKVNLLRYRAGVAENAAADLESQAKRTKWWRPRRRRKLSLAAGVQRARAEAFRDAVADLERVEDREGEVRVGD